VTQLFPGIHPVDSNLTCNRYKDR